MDKPFYTGTTRLNFPEGYLRQLSEDLSVKFDGVFSEDVIHCYVLESHTALMRTSKITASLTTDTIRFAHDRLTALAQARGAIESPLPEILFVSPADAGRAQIAAGFATALSNNAVQVRSAGCAPASQLDPLAVTVMREVGIDIGRSFPKPLTDDVLQAADAVVTMGCADQCPLYLGKRYEDWVITRPSRRGISDARDMRDTLRSRVEKLLRSMRVDLTMIPALSA